MKYLFGLILLVFICQPSQAQKSLGLLAPLIGEWEGTATQYQPRDKSRGHRVETVKVTCTQALKGTYIECSSTWTQSTGESRELRTFFNYDRRSRNYDILYLYDDWPGKVNYQLIYDPSTKKFEGRDFFTSSGGVPAEEKVEWMISEDGQTITSKESNHYKTDKEGYWPTTFEFTWKKIK